MNIRNYNIELENCFTKPGQFKKNEYFASLIHLKTSMTIT